MHAATAASFVSANRRNVQLDQFSNISRTGQCPGHVRQMRQCAGIGGQPSDEIYFLIQMSRYEKDLSRTYRAVCSPFALFPLLSLLCRICFPFSSFPFLSFVRPFVRFLFRCRRCFVLPRATRGRFSPSCTNKNNAASDEPSRRREGNDGCNALPTFIKKL